MNRRSRNYVFTSFKLEIETKHVGDGESIRYLVWGEEVCPTTGKKHLQGYVEFREGVTVRRAQTLLDLPRCWFHARRGTAKQAVDYVKKDGSVTEHGVPGKQGKRTDLDAVRDLMADGGGLRDVLLEGASYQGARYAQLWLSALESKRTDRPEVRWYWGETGSGKSRAAGIEAAECDGGPDDVYWHAGGKWWDGYDGHGVVIMDDFRPEDMKYNKLLKLLDYNPLRLEVKGGYRQFKAKLVIITMPKHPDGCYGEAGEDLGQLIRRIDVIKEFTL